MDKKLAKLIDARCKQILDSNDTSAEMKELQAGVRAMQALPVYCDLGKTYGLKKNLSVVVHNEWDGAIEIRQDQQSRNFVLAQAASLYPELVSLRPVKPDDARECPACKGGAVYDSLERSGLSCDCGGLGWLPAS